MRDLMAVTKALADENRVRILMALEPKELCVCQIVELLDLAPSTVSKHMAILKQARLVDEPQGRSDGCSTALPRRTRRRSRGNDRPGVPAPCRRSPKRAKTPSD